MTEKQEAADRREIIKKHIMEKDGCTKTQVIDYMNKIGKSATVTTHKVIQELISDGTVLLKPDKKNRRIHHLHIDNKFSKIHLQLEKIKQLMDLMDKPIRNVLKYHPPPASSDKELMQKLEANYVEKPTNAEDIYGHLIYPYEEAVSMMLRVLFEEISRVVLSEKDAQSLRTDIVKLINRLSGQLFNVTRIKEYLDLNIKELRTVQLSTTKEFAEKNNIDMGVRKTVIETIKDFESKFLDDGNSPN